MLRIRQQSRALAMVSPKQVRSVPEAGVRDCRIVSPGRAAAPFSDKLSVGSARRGRNTLKTGPPEGGTTAAFIKFVKKKIVLRAAGLAGVAVMSFVAIAACAPSLKDGGSIVAVVASDGTTTAGGAVAQLYSSVDGSLPPANPYGSIALGECDAIPGSSKNDYTFESRDLGASMHLTSGMLDVVLVESSSGGLISYRSATLGSAGFPGGISYDVVFADAAASAGTHVWTGSLVMPSIPSVTLPPGIGSGSVVLATSAFTIAFDPPGAQDVYAVFTGASGKGRVCHVPVDAAFTVPANVASAIPATGTISFDAFNTAHETLEGRRVDVVGESIRSATYTH
jgi:hypothetical protein